MWVQRHRLCVLLYKKLPMPLAANLMLPAIDCPLWCRYVIRLLLVVRQACRALVTHMEVITNQKA
ncbi:hypothetical protein A7P85_01675 [Eikenella corrodens]|uniref:Uncharacterized protein n=1 Tax=Eikenella corrodens TaxID=539 RepID=A0A1A9RHF5_EIKCO|nr:hypothetical protein A7P85_01675 [Eikenella corrodens]